MDTQTESRVAIKIIRAIPKYRDASKIEIRVLQKLKERDPMNRQYVRSSSSFHDLMPMSIANAYTYFTTLTTGTTFALSPNYWACVYMTSSRRMILLLSLATTSRILLDSFLEVSHVRATVHYM